MYFRPEQVLEQYEIEVKSISKGRECYLCETNLGIKALKEYNGSKERAQFLVRMLFFLEQAGLNVETVMTTKEGEIFSLDEEEQRYILVNTYRGAECDAKSEEDMRCAVEMLAILHRESERFQEEVPSFLVTDSDRLFLLYEKHNRELRLVRNYIRSKKKKSGFEELFMSQYAGYYKKAEAVTALLKEADASNVRRGFCHGDFNQHNLIFAKEGSAIVNMENYSYQFQIADLANFLRKMMEKNNWNIKTGMDLLECYNRERELRKEEFCYLYFYLAYPEKFWKIANHYNQSHKIWLSERDREKLEKVTGQELQKEQFLQSFYRQFF